MIFFIFFSLIVDAILVYYLIVCAKDLAYLDKLLEKYENKEKYIESTCEQCVDICEKTEKKLEDHIKTSRTKTQRAYFKGVSDGKGKQEGVGYEL